MPSTRRSHRLVPALLVLAGTALGGCSGETPPSPAVPHADTTRALERALEQRARAVRRGDAAAFARTLGAGAAFRSAQRTWFDNLRQLPVERLRYRFDPASVVREGDGYWVTVDEVLQLDGFDEEPVAAPDRFRFVVGPSGRMRLTSVTDPSWEAAHHVQPQPWDLRPVEVRAGAGVLGVFDAGSVTTADSLLASVEDGIADVSALVPYDWSRTVVVYALSDPTFLTGLEDVPGEDPERLDAVSFPVGGGTRFVLNPRVVDRPGPERDRLVRHELTHVAVGTADDHAPVWLAEGLAEWVSVRPLPPEERRIPGAAIAAARAGDADLPDDGSFNDDDSQAHYGLAWWAVEHVADSYGEQVPWLLLDALGAAGADVDRVLRDDFGTSTRELARQADRLILTTYDAGAVGDAVRAPS
jgi:hypothetical protein